MHTTKVGGAELFKYVECSDFEPINNDIFSISLIFISKWISDGYSVRNICYGLLLNNSYPTELFKTKILLRKFLV
jgi:hypothetical protein